MRTMFRVMVTCGCLIMSIPAFAQKPSLKGSKASVDRMAREAEVEDLSHMGTGAKILDFFGRKILVELKGDENYHLDGVSYPYVRREVRTFVERLSLQSIAPCQDGLTVTSSARPIDEQPSNASKKSVHPTGMAVDFRIPKQARCRVWIEKTLLGLEGRRVLEATRERNPPHYHVAVFPKRYAEYLVNLKDAAKAKKNAVATKKKVVVKAGTKRPEK